MEINQSEDTSLAGVSSTLMSSEQERMETEETQQAIQSEENDSTDVTSTLMSEAQERMETEGTQQAIQSEDNDSIDVTSTLMSRAQELMENGETQQAIICYELLLNNDELDSDRGAIACDHLAICYSDLGIHAKALRSVLRMMQYTTPNADICCQIGHQFFVQQKWSDSAYWYDLATRMPSTAASPSTDANRTWIPHLRQCVCYDKLGDFQRAYNHHKQAEMYVPDHPSVQYNEEYFGDYPEVRKVATTGECSLSLLVPSVPERQGMLSPLLWELYHQAFGKPVEIIVLIDNKKRKIGAKRNQLLQQAQGCFVAFIDDDDRISPNYVSSLLTAIEQQPDADCIVFDVQVKSKDVQSKVCKYGFEYVHGYDEQYYYRKPNHLMCYAKNIASRHLFLNVNYGEDDEWAQRCAADIKVQHRIPEVLYTYEWVKRPLQGYQTQ